MPGQTFSNVIDSLTHLQNHLSKENNDFLEGVISLIKSNWEDFSLRELNQILEKLHDKPIVFLKFLEKYLETFPWDNKLYELLREDSPYSEAFEKLESNGGVYRDILRTGWLQLDLAKDEEEEGLSEDEKTLSLEQTIDKMVAENETVYTNIAPLFFLQKYFNLKNVDDNEKKNVAKALLAGAVKMKNAALVQILEKIGIDDINNLLSPEALTTYHQLLKVKDPLFFSSHMLTLTSAFGKITYSDGLITLAQIANRKSESYPFRPTLLKKEEFQNYLSIIASSGKSVDENFIISGSHWISGKIQIDQAGNVNVWIIDAQGLTANPQGIVDPHGNASEIVKAVSQSFPLIPKINIVINELRRQGSVRGCSVFAIDDCRHLSTLENYLSQPYHQEQGVFAYLFDHVEKEIECDQITLYSTTMPPSMVRTLQSGKLMTEVLPSYSTTEKNLSLKKTREGQKPVTVNTLLEENNDFVANPTTGKMQNQRLKNALNKMANYDYQYLVQTPREEVERNMRKFTLDAFRERFTENLSYSSATHDGVIFSDIYGARKSAAAPVEITITETPKKNHPSL